MRILPLLALLLAAPAVSVLAQEAPDSATLAAGKKIFEGKGLCFSCHGKKGEGLLGPATRLAGRPFAHTSGSQAEIVALIRTGIDAEKSRSGQIMPPKGGSRLTDAELAQVAAYVRKLNSDKPLESSTAME